MELYWDCPEDENVMDSDKFTEWFEKTKKEAGAKKKVYYQRVCKHIPTYFTNQASGKETVATVTAALLAKLFRKQQLFTRRCRIQVFIIIIIINVSFQKLQRMP